MFLSLLITLIQAFGPLRTPLVDSKPLSLILSLCVSYPFNRTNLALPIKSIQYFMATLTLSLLEPLLFQ